MARHRSFVPQSLTENSLEGRVVLSTFGDIGDWFSSQYNNVKKDLGITHKAKNNTATINQLVNHAPQLNHPVPASSLIHHPARTVHAVRIK